MEQGWENIWLSKLQELLSVPKRLQSVVGRRGDAMQCVNMPLPTLYLFFFFLIYLFETCYWGQIENGHIFPKWIQFLNFNIWYVVFVLFSIKCRFLNVHVIHFCSFFYFFLHLAQRPNIFGNGVVCGEGVNHWSLLVSRTQLFKIILWTTSFTFNCVLGVIGKWCSCLHISKRSNVWWDLFIYFNCNICFLQWFNFLFNTFISTVFFCYCTYGDILRWT